MTGEERKKKKKKRKKVKEKIKSQLADTGLLNIEC